MTFGAGDPREHSVATFPPRMLRSAKVEAFISIVSITIRSRKPLLRLQKVDFPRRVEHDHDRRGLFPKPRGATWDGRELRPVQTLLERSPNGHDAPSNRGSISRRSPLGQTEGCSLPKRCGVGGVRRGGGDVRLRGPDADLPRPAGPLPPDRRRSERSQGTPDRRRDPAGRRPVVDRPPDVLSLYSSGSYSSPSRSSSFPAM